MAAAVVRPSRLPLHRARPASDKSNPTSPDSAPPAACRKGIPYFPVGENGDARPQYVSSPRGAVKESTSQTSGIRRSVDLSRPRTADSEQPGTQSRHVGRERPLSVNVSVPSESTQRRHNVVANPPRSVPLPASGGNPSCGVRMSAMRAGRAQVPLQSPTTSIASTSSSSSLIADAAERKGVSERRDARQRLPRRTAVQRAVSTAESHHRSTTSIDSERSSKFQSQQQQQCAPGHANQQRSIGAVPSAPRHASATRDRSAAVGSAAVRIDSLQKRKPTTRHSSTEAVENDTTASHCSRTRSKTTAAMSNSGRRSVQRRSSGSECFVWIDCSDKFTDQRNDVSPRLSESDVDDVSLADSLSSVTSDRSRTASSSSTLTDDADISAAEDTETERPINGGRQLQLSGVAALRRARAKQLNADARRKTSTSSSKQPLSPPPAVVSHPPASRVTPANVQRIGNFGDANPLRVSAICQRSAVSRSESQPCVMSATAASRSQQPASNAGCRIPPPVRQTSIPSPPGRTARFVSNADGKLAPTAAAKSGGRQSIAAARTSAANVDKRSSRSNCTTMQQSPAATTAIRETGSVAPDGKVPAANGGSNRRLAANIARISGVPRAASVCHLPVSSRTQNEIAKPPTVAAAARSLRPSASVVDVSSSSRGIIKSTPSRIPSGADSNDRPRQTQMTKNALDRQPQTSSPVTDRRVLTKAASKRSSQSKTDSNADDTKLSSPCELRPVSNAVKPTTHTHSSNFVRTPGSQRPPLAPSNSKLKRPLSVRSVKQPTDILDCRSVNDVISAVGRSASTTSLPTSPSDVRCLYVESASHKDNVDSLTLLLQRSERDSQLCAQLSESETSFVLSDIETNAKPARPTSDAISLSPAGAQSVELSAPRLLVKPYSAINRCSVFGRKLTTPPTLSAENMTAGMDSGKVISPVFPTELADVPELDESDSEWTLAKYTSANSEASTREFRPDESGRSTDRQRSLSDEATLKVRDSAATDSTDSRYVITFESDNIVVLDREPVVDCLTPDDGVVNACLSPYEHLRPYVVAVEQGNVDSGGTADAAAADDSSVSRSLPLSESGYDTWKSSQGSDANAMTGGQSARRHGENAATMTGSERDILTSGTSGGGAPLCSSKNINLTCSVKSSLSAHYSAFGNDDESGNKLLLSPVYRVDHYGNAVGADTPEPPTDSSSSNPSAGERLPPAADSSSVATNSAQMFVSICSVAAAAGANSASSPPSPADAGATPSQRAATQHQPDALTPGDKVASESAALILPDERRSPPASACHDTTPWTLPDRCLKSDDTRLFLPPTTFDLSTSKIDQSWCEGDSHKTCELLSPSEYDVSGGDDGLTGADATTSIAARHDGTSEPSETPLPTFAEPPLADSASTRVHRQSPITSASQSAEAPSTTAARPDTYEAMCDDLLESLEPDTSDSDSSATAASSTAHRRPGSEVSAPISYQHLGGGARLAAGDLSQSSTVRLTSTAADAAGSRLPVRTSSRVRTEIAVVYRRHAVDIVDDNPHRRNAARTTATKPGSRLWRVVEETDEVDALSNDRECHRALDELVSSLDVQSGLPHPDNEHQTLDYQRQNPGLDTAAADSVTSRMQHTSPVNAKLSHPAWKPTARPVKTLEESKLPSFVTQSTSSSKKPSTFRKLLSSKLTSVVRRAHNRHD